MAIINQRWPRDLSPESCTFGRTRNDILQRSPRTRQTSVIVQGRRLWRAECSWTLPNDDRLAKLRHWLESLEGFAGSVQLWDFGSPYPYGLNLVSADTAATRIFWSYLGNRAPWSWTGFPAHWSLDATVLLTGAYSLGATTIEIDGADPSKLVAVQGQYIQIGRRVYLVAETVSSDGAGVAEIELQTPLLANAADNDPVRLVEAACEMQLVTQDLDEGARAGDGFKTVSASFMETAEDLT